MSCHFIVGSICKLASSIDWDVIDPMVFTSHQDLRAFPKLMISFTAFKIYKNEHPKTTFTCLEDLIEHDVREADQYLDKAHVEIKRENKAYNKWRKEEASKKEGKLSRVWFRLTHLPRLNWPEEVFEFRYK